MKCDRVSSFLATPEKFSCTVSRRENIPGPLRAWTDFQEGNLGGSARGQLLGDGKIFEAELSHFICECCHPGCLSWWTRPTASA